MGLVQRRRPQEHPFAAEFKSFEVLSCLSRLLAYHAMSSCDGAYWEDGSQIDRGESSSWASVDLRAARSLHHRPRAESRSHSTAGPVGWRFVRFGSTWSQKAPLPDNQFVFDNTSLVSRFYFSHYRSCCVCELGDFVCLLKFEGVTLRFNNCFPQGGWVLRMAHHVPVEPESPPRDASKCPTWLTVLILCEVHPQLIKDIECGGYETRNAVHGLRRHWASLRLICTFNYHLS